MDGQEVQKYFGPVDFVIFICLLLVSAVIGIYFAYKDRGNKSTENYYFGNHEMSPILVAMSMAVSVVSALTVLGIPVEVYYYGTIFLWFLPATMAATLFAVVYFIPLIYRLQLTTIYEYLEKRYSKTVRKWCSGMTISGWLIYMGFTVYMPALALNAVTPLNLYWAIFMTSIICTFYTTAGGMKAVIWTDMLQGIIMIFGSLAVFIKVLVLIGGFDELSAAVERGGRENFLKFDTDPRIRSTALAIFGGMFINSCVDSCCSQIYAQRYMSCKSVKDAKIAAVIRVIPIGIFMVLASANGLAMYAYYEGCDPYSSGILDKKDQTTPYMAVDIFRDIPGMAGLFVSAAYSGTLSTVSSGVNALSAMTLEDFIRPRWPKLSTSKASSLSMLFSVLYGMIVMGVAYIMTLLDGTIVKISLSLAGVFNGPILCIYFMGTFVPWANTKGALSGLLVGFITTAWVAVGAIIYGPLPELDETLPISTEACNLTSHNLLSNFTGSGFADMTTSFDQTTTAIARTPIADTLYSLSPYIYGVLGFSVGCIVTITVSLLTGRNKPSEANPELFLPIIDNKKIFPECVIRFFRFGVPERMDPVKVEIEFSSE